MAAPTIHEITAGRYYADLGFRDREGLVASYFLPQPDGWSIVETGPTTCQEHLLKGLAAAGIEPNEVRRVFVTHIHLDHAGGVGALAARLPRAKFYVHASGAPHLVDPSRLVASARRAWGAAADPLWGEIAPVPGDRLVALDGGESFPLSGGTLHAVATPGHARHHLAFFDDGTGSLMSGDAAGVRLPGAARARPAVPPPDLDLEALFESLRRMRELAPRRILYTHFGESPDGAADLRAYERAVTEWRDVAFRAAQQDPSPEAIARALREHDTTSSGTPQSGTGPAEAQELISGYSLAAQGLLRYFQTRGLLAE